ncbi:MAG: ATP-binding protein [Prochloraceae cyanobacterium]
MSKKINILLIEDNPVDALLIEKQLKKSNFIKFEITHADYLHKAISKLQKQNFFDVVLLDLTLPDSKGINTFLTIKELNPCLPIILLTGISDEKIAIKALRQGAQDYLLKDEAHGKLIIQAIRYAIERKQNQVRLEQNLIKLKESEDKYRSIINTMSEGVWVLDSRGYGTFANQQLAEMLGYSICEMLNKHLFDFVDESILIKAKKLLKARKKGGSKKENYKFIRKDGSDLWVIISTNPIFDERGEYNGILAIITDITEQKKQEKTILKLEKQRELSQMQLRFFAMASHEFRTPLSTILVIVQSLISHLEKLSHEKVLKKLFQLELVAKNMTYIIDNILKINRSETENSNLEIQLLKPENICKSILEEIKLNPRKDCEIILINQGENRLIPINPKLFNYILTNLLTNAVKYSPKNSTIYLILNPQPKELVLMVKDCGIGIVKSDLPQLFEPFYRGKNIKNIPGSGLGLTLVKKCVELQGGTIKVDTDLNCGTTFTVAIPIKCEQNNICLT